MNWGTATAVPRGFTLDDFNALGASPSPLSAVAAGTTVVVTDNAQPLTGEVVTANYFSVIGAGMLLGRPLLPDDAPAPGARPVVVLSHEAWRAHYASDQTIVGREITLSGQPFTVVGVTKPGQLLPGDDIVGFWVPLTMANAFQVTNPWQERAIPHWR